jgi:hypothetical protein
MVYPFLAIKTLSAEVSCEALLRSNDPPNPKDKYAVFVRKRERERGRYLFVKITEGA